MTVGSRYVLLAQPDFTPYPTTVDLLTAILEEMLAEEIAHSEVLAALTYLTEFPQAPEAIHRARVILAAIEKNKP